MPSGTSLAGSAAAEIVRQRDEGDQQDQGEADHRGALVDLAGDGPPADSLDRREEDVAAVERQQGQQVEQGKREADQAEDLEVETEAHLERVARDLDDADRARQLRAALVMEKALDRQAHPLRRLPAIVEREAERCRDAVA